MANLTPRSGSSVSTQVFSTRISLQMKIFMWLCTASPYWMPTILAHERSVSLEKPCIKHEVVYSWRQLYPEKQIILSIPAHCTYTSKIILFFFFNLLTSSGQNISTRLKYIYLAVYSKSKNIYWHFFNTDCTVFVLSLNSWCIIPYSS